ncbi:MAG: hypothetical protein NZT92_13940 [Abditibacteriales bacterium]|nr:hypothetical protein [Abditibacteriales bacterium]MDW8367022.1 hypothetical protein [Abditibacteriales bacterium]
MSEVKKVVVNYPPGLDTLSIWFQPRRESKLEPITLDFFKYVPLDDPNDVAGFEWLDSSQFIDEGNVDLPIPEPDLRFDVGDEEAQGLTLTELAQWAYQQCVAAKVAVPAEGASENRWHL